MSDTKILRGKRILIVDDEEDVRETLSDLLDMCHLDLAPDFETARKFLAESTYDVAILDIMGVKGYDLLEETRKKGIPTLMFTAHALNPDAFVKSLKGGAKAYIPKEKMSDIAIYAADILEAHSKGIQRPGKWFTRLKSFFEKQFGHDWLDQYNQARKKYYWLDFDE
jgi:DNA-binding NtrC family response regulator